MIVHIDKKGTVFLLLLLFVSSMSINSIFKLREYDNRRRYKGTQRYRKHKELTNAPSLKAGQETEAKGIFPKFRNTPTIPFILLSPETTSAPKIAPASGKN